MNESAGCQDHSRDPDSRREREKGAGSWPTPLGRVSYRYVYEVYNYPWAHGFFVMALASGLSGLCGQINHGRKSQMGQ